MADRRLRPPQALGRQRDIAFPHEHVEHTQEIEIDRAEVHPILSPE
ncbi:hypothetical protein [Rhizobium esperanzae]|uniref:Uncharacterized protein n=1 Tax=Rhizobium esperanzae TaxID=1967781 RepID=A0A7W6R3P1_9HYPH|nr:hypothetical protein [Rhizobium esperanzae]MBB4236238.1 hypothetical protein [Rhizobium esperanzae]